MAFQDGADLASATIISHTIFNKYFGSGGSFDAVETNQVTTAGDLVVSNGSKSLTRLAIGSARQVLETNAAANNVQWVPSAQSVMTAKGDILSSSGSNVLTRTAVGADGTVLTAKSSATSGISFEAAPGFTDPAKGESVSMQVQGLYADPWSKSSAVANRIYGAWLMPVWQSTSITEIIYNEIDSGGNMIASIYSSTDSTMTRVATTGSISVPTSSGDLTKVSLSATLNVATRYLILTSMSGTPDFLRVTPDSLEIQRVGSTFYYDPGSLTHASTINWSSVTKTDSDGIVCLLNNGGIIT